MGKEGPRTVMCCACLVLPVAGRGGANAHKVTHGISSNKCELTKHDKASNICETISNNTRQRCPNMANPGHYICLFEGRCGLITLTKRRETCFRQRRRAVRRTFCKRVRFASDSSHMRPNWHGSSVWKKLRFPNHLSWDIGTAYGSCGSIH